MRKNGIIAVSLAAMMSLSSVFSSFAGQWMQDNVGWWWQEGSWYPTSEWMIINGKEYYFGADGYMLHDTMQDGFVLDSSGARVIPDLGLEVAPYKAELDAILADSWSYYNICTTLNNPAYGIGFSSEYGFDNWIDCGTYYIVKDVSLFGWGGSDNGDYTIDIGKLSEIRIRKDGIYNFCGNSEKLETLSLEEWKREGHGCPRFGLLFDDKGYVIRFRDTNAG